MSEESERCYAAALRILQIRWNSAVELRRKLGAKGFDSATIQEALTRLTGGGWIDDARFAASYVRAKTLRRKGRIRIAGGLAAAGVNRETAARALADNADPDRDREDLIALCRKKMAMLTARHGAGYVSTDAGRKKLAAYLLRQGYDAALVWSVLREIESEASS
jgi:regulatory protein